MEFCKLYAEMAAGEWGRDTERGEADHAVVFLHASREVG